MHRDLLLSRLRDYALRYPRECAVVNQFIAFIGAYANCFERSCVPGHITGSAWLQDSTGQRVLLTHHKKLDIWVQLGGHSDGDCDTLDVALREANEESGLQVSPISLDIFDIDCHMIPARKGESEHFHYDVRFWLRAATDDFTVTQESHALRWLGADELESLTSEESVLRMQRKWLAAKF